MRTTFFQKIGTLYGHSLYLNRPVSILMDMDFMKADVSENISKIGVLIELLKLNEAQISVLKVHQQKLLSKQEQEVQLRYSLEYQSASIQNLLDHADEGFFWFGKDMVVKKNYSYKCRCIFNQNIGGKHFLDLVMPHFNQEIQGLTYLEALASGLPALCRRDDCLKNVIVNGQNGWQYESDKDFFDKLSFFLSSDALRKSMSQNAERTAIQNFSAAAFAEKVEAVYVEVLRGEGREHAGGSPIQGI